MAGSIPKNVGDICLEAGWAVGAGRGQERTGHWSLKSISSQSCLI